MENMDAMFSHYAALNQFLKIRFQPQYYLYAVQLVSSFSVHYHSWLYVLSSQY